MIFNTANKGKITQGFMQNLNPLYHAEGLAGHTGVDSVKGYGQPIIADNSGYVYKIFHANQAPSHWQAVYMLVPYPEYGADCFMEICSGHLSRVDVAEGQQILANQRIGLEGNFGDVYAQVVRITAAMQKAGDKRGSHEHCSYRPVKLIRGGQVQVGHFYLDKVDGGVYRDSQGIYEVCITNAQTKGYVDPMQFVPHPLGTPQDLEKRQLSLIALLKQFISSFKK